MNLSVRISGTKEQLADFTLEKCEEKGKVVWRKKEDEFCGPEFELRFFMDEKQEGITDIKKGLGILDTELELRNKFSELLFEEKMNELIQEEDGFEAVDESDGADGEKMDPYNPKLIRVDPKNFPVFQIQQMIEEGEIDLSPDFQRNFVWTDITRKSRLIESLLLRIPLPVFYFAQDEEGIFQVVDGVQRLSVIHSFLNNNFRLKNLEYLKECEGRWYKNPKAEESQNLSGMFARRIEQSQIFVNVIDPQTPPKVKYDIFKRINTGGKALNNQEIRNCLAVKRTREFLHTLSRSDSFLCATRGSISPTRMADEELILRFIAFYLIDHKLSTVPEYRGGMDELLDETVNILNHSDLAVFREIRMRFLDAMDGAFYLFGSNAFRKANFVNKALFLGISRVLTSYSLQEIKGMDAKKAELTLKQEIEKNALFSNALSMATNDARNVKIVYDTLERLIRKCVNE